MQEFPMAAAVNLEDWLLDIANARGARVVMRDPMNPVAVESGAPPTDILSNEELVVAICQPHKPRPTPVASGGGPADLAG